MKIYLNRENRKAHRAGCSLLHAEDPIMIREIDIEEKPLKKDMLYFACSECCNVSKMYQINHEKIVEIMDGIQYDCGAYDDGVRREVQIWTKERCLL